MADPEEARSLPLPDRFTHKNWKVRKEGYESAVDQFKKTPSEDDPVFQQFLYDPSLFKGAVSDSNVAAQQEGLNAYCAFLKYAGYEACTRTRQLTLFPLIEKALPQTRPAAKASAIEALLLCIELDRSDVVVEELIPAVSHKVPKVIAAAINALTVIVHNYGCKTVEPKPILKCLPKCYAHADKNVRAEAQNLTVELYRWLKDAMKPLFWADLKPVQQTDLDKLFENVKQEPPPKQERFTRVQQAAMAEASEQAEAAGGDPSGDPTANGADDNQEEEELDAFDLAEEVDVFQKLSPDFHSNLGSSKWKERKEALDGLFVIVNVPRIRDGPFDDIVRGLAKSMKDANVAVVTVAANCIEALAKGLRNAFAKYRSTVMSPIMERLKEKKQSVADALGAALDAVFMSTGLSECFEDIIEFLGHKNPQVKQSTTKFLVRCLRTTKVVPEKGEVKAIAQSSTNLLGDSDAVTRTAGAEAMGTLMKIMGERAMSPFMEGIDNIKKQKIHEFFETAQVRAKERPKPVAPPPKPAAAPPASGTGKKPTTRRVVKKPSAAPAAQRQDEPPVQLTSPAKPVSRLGAPKTSGGSGLKPQRKIPAPGGTSPAPKRSASPPAPPSGPSKVSSGSRGLTGRSLGRTPAPAAAPEPPQPAPQLSGLAQLERAELEQLRVENQQIVEMVEKARAERSRITSELHELQNQNAQLIEDHTRDVLNIKTKETQLVRARSDAESAEQTVATQQREIDRLKRELSRALRAAQSSPSNDARSTYSGGDMYNNETASMHSHLSSSAAMGGAGPGSSRYDSGSHPYQSRMKGYHHDTSPTEELESNHSYNSSHHRPMHSIGSNNSLSTNNNQKPSSFNDQQAAPTSPVRHRFPASSFSSGRSSPSRASRLSQGTTISPFGPGGERRPLPPGHEYGTKTRGSGRSTPTNGTSTTGIEPAENWKRAAEVTSQLKARIEQMKARQGIVSRH